MDAGQEAAKDDLWAVVGRARCDLDFGGRLRADFDKTVKDAGYALDQDQLAHAKKATASLFMPPQNYPGMQDAPTAEDLRKIHALRMKSMERQFDFTNFMIESAKRTFSYASQTYRSIAIMNWLTFLTGLALFGFSAAYALLAHTKAYSILFAGMGVSSFVAAFVLRPPEKAQNALSHLVETEVAFMNYFEQQSFWENYASIPQGNALNPAAIEKASKALMESAQQTMAMLDRYVSDRNPDRPEDGKLRLRHSPLPGTQAHGHAAGSEPQ